MKNMLKSIIIIIFLMFNGISFAQSDKWTKCKIFKESDTIIGLVNSKSISFDRIKFRKSENDTTEYLTVESIDGFIINNNVYEKVHIRAFGSFGHFKFGKLIEKGELSLYQTNGQSYSSLQNQNNDVYILTFKNTSLTLKLNAFYKLKNKKKIAKELNEYLSLKEIILAKDFDFNKLWDEIIKINSE
jgi:hypothetical protein